MERLILCGGGHVSLEVAHIARRLEFELVVIDDRSEFASPERFPMAARVVCAPFLEALDALVSRDSDYYVILPRGHAHDRDCLEHVLRGKYAPRGVGTWMLVRPDGSVLGTIGGGAVEHLAVQEAKALWAHGGGPVRRHYDLTPGAAELGMVCGGDIDVEFEVRK